jgi:hypothetical protein
MRHKGPHGKVHHVSGSQPDNDKLLAYDHAENQSPDSAFVGQVPKSIHKTAAPAWRYCEYAESVKVLISKQTTAERFLERSVEMGGFR